MVVEGENVEPVEATLLTEQEIEKFLLEASDEQIERFLESSPPKTRTIARIILDKLKPGDSLDEIYNNYVENYIKYYNDTKYLSKNALNNKGGIIDSKHWGRKAADIKNKIQQYGTFQEEHEALKKFLQEKKDKEAEKAKKAENKKVLEAMLISGRTKRQLTKTIKEQEENIKQQEKETGIAAENKAKKPIISGENVKVAVTALEQKQKPNINRNK